MSTSDRTALVTGGSGFTGRYMQQALIAAGYRVVGLGTYMDTGESAVQADLMNAGAINDALCDIAPNVIVHLAAVAFVAHGDANAFYKVNLQGTRNLLEAILGMAKQPDCVLLASSANVYGNASEGMLSEDARLAPVNDYAVSKLAMEYLAGLYIDRLPIVITRPFNYTGVGQMDCFLIPKIVSHFRNRSLRIELGNLDVRRDFGDVRALVQAYRRLLETPGARGKIVNVCSEHSYSLRQVISMCESITGHSLEVAVNPAFARQNDVKTLCGDAARLRALIGEWRMPVLEETLKWMLAA